MKKKKNTNPSKILPTKKSTMILDDRVKANGLNHYFVESVKDLRKLITSIS